MSGPKIFFYNKLVFYSFYSFFSELRMATKLLRLVHDKKREATDGGTVISG